MCRNTISISWDGRLYDCDFNQMLDLDALPDDAAMHVSEFDLAKWQSRRIVTQPPLLRMHGRIGKFVRRGDGV